MSALVKDFISLCSVCNQFLSKQQKELIIIHKVLDRLWSKIRMNLFNFISKDCVITTTFLDDDNNSDFWDTKELINIIFVQVL